MYGDSPPITTCCTRDVFFQDNLFARMFFTQASRHGHHTAAHFGGAGVGADNGAPTAPADIFMTAAEYTPLRDDSHYNQPWIEGCYGPDVVQQLIADDV